MNLLRKNLRAVVLAAFMGMTLVTAAALAADGEPMAGRPWDIFSGIWATIGTAVTGLFAWGMQKLVAYLTDLDEKAKEEGKQIRWQGFVARAVARVAVAGERAGKRLRDLTAEAREEGSPGGSRVTKKELDKIGREMKLFFIEGWGSWSALAEEAGAIVGGDVEQWIDGLVDSELDRQVAKAEGKPVAPRTEALPGPEKPAPKTWRSP